MTRFDARYYQRFYGDADGVHDPTEIDHLATAVHELCTWWGVEPESVLDVGAGVGMWRNWYRSRHPTAQLMSIDISPYACEQWDHELHDIATWTPAKPFDLVICHGVVHYLDDHAATAAIGNLGAATSFVMYLELPTAHDLTEVVDPERTDMAVHHRSGQWYRTRLTRHFRQVGAGLWVKHGTVPMFELEAASVDGQELVDGRNELDNRGFSEVDTVDRA